MLGGSMPEAVARVLIHALDGGQSRAQFADGNVDHSAQGHIDVLGASLAAGHGHSHYARVSSTGTSQAGLG